MKLMSDTANQLRFCRRCDLQLPIDEFRLRLRNSSTRHDMCRECHNAAEYGCRLKTQSKRDRRAINRYLSRLKLAEGSAGSMLSST